MSWSSVAATGTLVLGVATSTPAVLTLRVLDDAGRQVVRRRVRDRRLVLTLPVGTHRVVLADERGLHDPARLAGTTFDVHVPRHGAVERSVTLGRGAAVRATTARWARVHAVHADGEVVETRADGLGRVVLAGLRAGAWTLASRDARRELSSDPVVLPLRAGGTAEIALPATTPTARLLVDVRGGDRRPVLATEVVVTDPTGRRVTAPVHGGLADVRGLHPGPLRVVLPASVGHLGTTADVTAPAGSLGHVTVVSPVGASLTGRVVQRGVHGPRYAAVVVLLDQHGVEVERVRTDDSGRFTLGAGLAAAQGLTVVATTGPETLHVTRAAVADVAVRAGVRHDLGEIELPAGGRGAVWAARTPAVAGMKLPSTRV